MHSPPSSPHTSILTGCEHPLKGKENEQKLNFRWLSLLKGVSVGLGLDMN